MFSRVTQGTHLAFGNIGPEACMCFKCVCIIIAFLNVFVCVCVCVYIYNVAIDVVHYCTHIYIHIYIHAIDVYHIDVIQCIQYTAPSSLTCYQAKRLTATRTRR